MAILKPSSWYNADGLPWSFGTDEGRLGAVAGYKTDGDERLIEVVIHDIAAFNATDEYVLSDKVCLPEGAVVTRVVMGAASEVYASSGSGVVSIGVIDDDFASNNDIDALLASASVAEMNAVGGTAAGDGVLVGGAALTKRQFLTLSVDTGVFQTGAGSVKIYFAIPKGAATDTLVYTK